MLFMVLSGGIHSFWEFLFVLAGYLVLLGVMMPVHEAAHAYVATRLGDDTPRRYGRLTLNPLAHVDWIGAAMIVLFGIGYAKAVPVNPRRFREPKKGMALVALAGPLSNVLMAAVSLLLFRLILFFGGGGMTLSGNFLQFSGKGILYAYLVLVRVFAGTNLLLAVFNLLPIPPLDGYRILSIVIPDKWTYFLERYFMYVRLIVLILVFSGVLDGPLQFLERLIGNGLCVLFRLPALF